MVNKGFNIISELVSFSKAGAVMVNGRGDGDVRAALFLPKFLADQVRYNLPSIFFYGNGDISMQWILWILYPFTDR